MNLLIKTTPFSLLTSLLLLIILVIDILFITLCFSHTLSPPDSGRKFFEERVMLVFERKKRRASPYTQRYL